MVLISEHFLGFLFLLAQLYPSLVVVNKHRLKTASRRKATLCFEAIDYHKLKSITRTGDDGHAQQTVVNVDDRWPKLETTPALPGWLIEHRPPCQLALVGGEIVQLQLGEARQRRLQLLPAKIEPCALVAAHTLTPPVIAKALAKVGGHRELGEHLLVKVWQQLQPKFGLIPIEGGVSIVGRYRLECPAWRKDGHRQSMAMGELNRLGGIPLPATGTAAAKDIDADVAIKTTTGVHFSHLAVSQLRLRPAVVEKDAIAGQVEGFISLVQLVLPLESPGVGRNAVVPNDHSTAIGHLVCHFGENLEKVFHQRNLLGRNRRLHVDQPAIEAIVKHQLYHLLAHRFHRAMVSQQRSHLRTTVAVFIVRPVLDDKGAQAFDTKIVSTRRPRDRRDGKLIWIVNKH